MRALVILLASAVGHAEPYRLRDHVAAVPGPEPPKATRCVFPPMVRPYIERERPRVAKCATDAKRRNPKLAGIVTVRFFVDREGTAHEAVADGVDAELASCVARAMLFVHFPRGLGGTTIIYPWRIL